MCHLCESVSVLSCLYPISVYHCHPPNLPLLNPCNPLIVYFSQAIKIKFGMQGSLIGMTSESHSFSSRVYSFHLFPISPVVPSDVSLQPCQFCCGGFFCHLKWNRIKYLNRIRSLFIIWWESHFIYCYPSLKMQEVLRTQGFSFISAILWVKGGLLYKSHQNNCGLARN